MECIGNHIHVKQWDEIMRPCPNFNGGLQRQFS